MRVLICVWYRSDTIGQKLNELGYAHNQVVTKPDLDKLLSAFVSIANVMVVHTNDGGEFDAVLNLAPKWLNFKQR